MWSMEKADSSAAWDIHSTPVQSVAGAHPITVALGRGLDFLWAELAAEMLAAGMANNIARRSLQANCLGKLDPLRPAHKGVAEARQEDDDRLERGVADGLLLHSVPSTFSEVFSQIQLSSVS